MLALSACGTITKTPPVSSVSQPRTCNVKDKIHLTQAIAALPPVQGDWLTFRGDLSRDGSHTTGGGSRLASAWSYCTGAAIFSSPVVSAGTVYIASTSGVLTALEARRGKMLWQFRVGGAIFSTPLLQKSTLYFGGLDGFVYAVDAASGHLRWRSKVDGEGAKIWSSPAVVDGLVVIGVASPLNEQPKIAGEVLAFDAVNGARRWRTWIEPDGAAGGGVWSSPAIDSAHGIAYIGTGDPDDGLVALNLHDGHILWHWRSVIKDVGDTDIGVSPLLYRNGQGLETVVVGGKDGTLYSLDAGKGRLLWSRHIGDHIYSSPAFAHGRIYAVAVQGRSAIAEAVDAATSNPLWQHKIPVIVYASPVIVDQTLYLSIGDGFLAGDGGVEVIDATNGRLLQYVDLLHAAASSPTPLPAWLFVGASDGNLYAFIRKVS